MKLNLTTGVALVSTIVSNAYQKPVTHPVVYLNYPAHTQIYEYQMSVVFGLYANVRAVPRVGKRFFFEGGGRDLGNSFGIFGGSK